MALFKKLVRVESMLDMIDADDSDLKTFENESDLDEDWTPNSQNSVQYNSESDSSSNDEPLVHLVPQSACTPGNNQLITGERRNFVHLQRTSKVHHCSLMKMSVYSHLI